MESDNSELTTPRLSSGEQEAFVAACDHLLAGFLNAATEADADKHLEYLQCEFITPLITSTLVRELRRGPSTSQYRIWADTETFREIQATVEGNIAVRLRQIRKDVGNDPGKPIGDFRGYVKAAARHACADYLRERRPGRHALDTALRAALNISADLALWRQEIRIDFYEWRCGFRTWKAANRTPKVLRSDPSLRTRLWHELRQENGTWAETLYRLFTMVQTPLLYTDLLDFLAVLWNVEEPYRAAAYERSSLRVQTPAVTMLDPESAAHLLGTLQELWELLRPLSSQQKAILLLRLPPIEDRNFLEEFARLGIAPEEEIAETLGLSLDELRFQYPLLPLQDADIAALLLIPHEEIRRIRQDARRRLERQKPKPI